MNRFGYVKLSDTAVFEKNETAIREENTVCLRVKTDERLLLFTSAGTVHQLKMSDVPFGKQKDKGIPADNLCNYDSAKENILKICRMEDIAAKTILLLTEKGMVKQCAGLEFESVKRTIQATRLNPGDRLFAVETADKPFIAMVTDENRAIRFSLGDIPAQRKASVGVKSFTLNEKEHIIFACLLEAKESMPVAIGKRTVDLSALVLKKRGAKPQQFR